MINFLLNHTPLFYLTQSLWRDEAFSVWISQGTFSEVIARTSGDFNPPLYYLLLNVWMHLFGKNEMVLRSLSFIFFLLLLLVIYKFAQAIFKNEKAARITLALSAVNPMLLYYAFELRMYSLLALCATASMYFLYTKKWVWYVVTTIAGLYTQPFMAFVVVTQCIYLLSQRQLSRVIKIGVVLALLYIPWVPTLITQLKSSGPMWIYPIDRNLIMAVLGNLYFGYEGTPGHLWPMMKIASLIFVVISILSLRNKNFSSFTKLCVMWIGIPLVLVLGISFFKPLYVLRYIIFVTVGELFLLSVWLTTLTHPLLKKILPFSIILLSLYANIIATDFHRKVPIRDTFMEINPMVKNDDVVYAETPLVFYESLFYAPSDIQVFLYNPERVMPPRYVGSGGMPERVWATSFPVFPKRAFVISENGDYRVVTQLIRSYETR